jgi:hypothetical protein
MFVRDTPHISATSLIDVPFLINEKTPFLIKIAQNGVNPIN